MFIKILVIAFWLNNENTISNFFLLTCHSRLQSTTTREYVRAGANRRRKQQHDDEDGRHCCGDAARWENHIDRYKHSGELVHSTRTPFHPGANTNNGYVLPRACLVVWGWATAIAIARFEEDFPFIFTLIGLWLSTILLSYLLFNYLLSTPCGPSIEWTIIAVRLRYHYTYPTVY